MNYVVKILFAIMLFYPLAHANNLSDKKYKTRYHKNGFEAQHLYLNEDHTFVRTCIQVYMCVGPAEKKVTGVWWQSADTLFLSDTLKFDQSLMSYYKRIFRTDDTVFITQTAYKIKKEKLTCLFSKTGKLQGKTSDFFPERKFDHAGRP